MDRLDKYFIIFFISFAAYFLLSILIIKKKIKIKKYLFFIIIILSIILRIISFFEEPLLSDDIYRYYFDGKVLSNYINPYGYPPNSEKLLFLQDELSKKVNHRHMNTVYPPLAQTLFFIGYKTGGGLSGIKLILILFDLGIIFLLYLLLKKLKQPVENIMIYIFNPLIIIEFYGSGHTEPAVAFFVLLSIYFYKSNKKFQSLISVFLSSLIKYYGILISPFFFRKIPWKKKLLAISIFLAFFIIFFNKNMFNSLVFYQRFFEFNRFLYKHFDIIFSKQISRLICFLIFSSACIYTFFKYKKNNKDTTYDYLTFTISIFSIYFFTTPTLYPWYITIIIPLLCFHKRLSLILFSGTVFLSYYILYDYKAIKKWQENYIILLVEYLPFIIFLILEFIFKNKRNNLKTSFKNSLNSPRNF